MTTTAVEIKGVRKQFGATVALERVDFDLRRGDKASVDWFDGAHMTVRAVRSTATVTVRRSAG